MLLTFDKMRELTFTEALLLQYVEYLLLNNS